MDRVHEGVHGLGPQVWSMDLGSMFCIRPDRGRLLMGHFRVAVCLGFEVSLGAQLLEGK